MALARYLNPKLSQVNHSIPVSHDQTFISQKTVNCMGMTNQNILTFPMGPSSYGLTF